MKKILLLSLVMLTACASPARREDIPSYLKYYKLKAPEGMNVQSCRGYGCQFINNVTLNKQQWNAITRPLKSKSKTPAQEREKLKQVIANFETQIGAMTGTKEDIEGTYVRLGEFQQDCVDESTNTTSYLMMLQNHGLLKFHTVARPEGRLPIIGGGLGPHQTAVIIEKGTGATFAVDSWFHDNGHPAEIAPLGEWKTGWRP